MKGEEAVSVVRAGYKVRVGGVRVHARARNNNHVSACTIVGENSAKWIFLIFAVLSTLLYLFPS